MRPSILVAPILGPPRDAVEAVKAHVSEHLGAETKISPIEIDAASVFHAARKQYNSTSLLAELNRAIGPGDDIVLGVTEVDLFIPVLTFVFGEAVLNGNVAVVSARRLDDTYYGLATNDALKRERLQKEALHELGHAFGLLHCEKFFCVMHSSTSVEDVDLKGSKYCPKCAGIAGI